MARQPEAPVVERRERMVTRARTRMFSDGSLTKKASLNSVTLGLDFAARAIAGFVVNPVLVRYLGDVGFGNWQVLQRLIGHTNPAGGRPSEALKWFIANRQSSDDVDVKRGAVGSAIAVWLLFLPILLAIGGVIAWFAPIWLHVPAGDHSMIRLAAAVLIGDIALMGLSNIPWAVLAGQNLGYKRMGLTASVQLVGAGFIVVAAILGAGIVGIAVATVATTALTGALYLWLVGRHVPWFGMAKPNVRGVRRFMGLSGWFLLWNLVTKVTMGSDIVVLGIAGSATAVTSYSLTRFIPITIVAAVTSVIFGMAPGLGGLIGAGEVARAARVRSETITVAWFMATVSGAGVLLWERSFLGLWVGERYYPGIGSTLLIVLMVLQLTLIRVDSNIIDLTLNLRRKVLLGLVSAALSVAFAWVLVSQLDMGIAGVAAGFIVGRAVQSLTYPFMVGRILQIPTGLQLRAVARPAVVTAALFAAAGALGREVGVSTWPGLVLVSVGSGLVLAVLAFFGGLPGPQRERLWGRARRVVRLR